MRRKVSALLGVALAMLLTVALAVPASAADPWTPSSKPMPTDPRFKYGMDYFYKELFDPQNPQGWKSLNVNETVNPSKTGGSWYLNNVRKTRTAPTGTTNKPLTGKIFLPGQPLPNGAPGGTVVKPPSVYKPTAPFAGSLGFGRLLGTAGAGMGGKTEAPSNWQEIARTKVSAGCDVANMRGGGCTSADFAAILSVTNCGHTATCKALGGKDAAGNLIASDTDWFKDTALPFLSDLWAKITGQTDSDEIATSGHTVINPRGCLRKIEFEQTGASSGIMHASGEVVKPRPASGTASTYWGADCQDMSHTQNLPSFATFVSTCMDVYGRTTDGAGTAYGKSSTLSFGSGRFWDNAGKSQLPLCADYTQLMAIQFRNGWTQAQYDASTTNYSAMTFTEYVNPDQDLDTTENTTVTTTTDCKVPTGETFSYSKSVQKTGAFIAPSCPEGSDMVGHNVSAAGAQKSFALDAGAESPGADAAYPGCAAGTPGCSLSIEIDGQACTTSREDCRNWPAVAAQSPSRVVCKWGTYAMPISDCYSIAEGYKSQTGMVFDPKSGSWVAVDNVGNPVPLSPAPWNPSNPAPVAGQNPSTTPGTGTAPGGSTFPTTGTNPSDGCSSPTWSWNPVEFVKNPVVCALKDTFIPKTDIQARSLELTATAQGVAPLSWMAKPMIGPSAGGCPNWRIIVGPVNQNVVCDSTFTNAILGVRGPMFGIVASAMLWPLLRSLWYSLIPIVRVTPSGSK